MIEAEWKRAVAARRLQCEGRTKQWQAHELELNTPAKDLAGLHRKISKPSGDSQ